MKILLLRLKHTVMKPQEIVIGKASAKELNKTQKEFNRLTAKIEKLKTTYEHDKTHFEAIGKRAHAELFPLKETLQKQTAEFLILVDEFISKPGITASEKKKGIHIILEDCGDLISEGHEELIPIFEKYSDQSYEEMKEEAEYEEADMVREMFERMTGHVIPDDVDVSTPEKFLAYLADLEEREQAKDERRQEKKEKAKAEKPKSEKEIAKEEKKKEEASQQFKSVRSVYFDLVKAFHPDQELDEVEKGRKTEIMKKVTLAYEKNDLLGLLQLQLEYERIDADHLDSIAEEKLKRFNTVLAKQVKEIQEEIDSFYMQISMMLSLSPFEKVSVKAISKQLESELDELKYDNLVMSRRIDSIKADFKAMKAYLKSFKIPKNDGFFWSF
jgi:hypothetical protein